MVLHSGFPLPRSVLQNVLWLVFALSFLWFPYIGMVTFPCRRNPASDRKRSSSRSESYIWGMGDPAHVDYTKIDPVTVSSDNASIRDVMQDQKRRLEQFCRTQNLPTTVHDEVAVHDLYHHIIVDDKRKVLFCYIPKVGCSNWKRVFLILQGLVNPSTSLRPSIEVFRQINTLTNYNPKEQQYRLRNYFKFMFIRHPPERVLSAYRNKIEHPLETRSSEKTLWDEVRLSILSTYRLKFNHKMAQRQEVIPSFAEFLHFLYDSDSTLMNEHYKSMVELCQPCAVKYDFVGNFATLRNYANIILDHLHINSSLFWDRGKHISNPTVSYVERYYSQLGAIDFKRFEDKFSDDIALFNHLFPSADDGGYMKTRSTVLGEDL